MITHSNLARALTVLAEALVSERRVVVVGDSSLALHELVSLQFENVRMIAAMPFYGVTLAELGQDEVESAVRVDTQLAGDRPSPNAFVALASQSDVALDAYAVIELEAPAKTEPVADV